MDINRLEVALAQEEKVIARARARQLDLIREAEQRQIPASAGCRSTAEWVAGRADVAPETACGLVRAAGELRNLLFLSESLHDGLLSFERAAALARLARPGEDGDTVLEHMDTDIEGIRRRVARRRRLSREQEREVFAERYLVFQPNLDESSWDVRGRLPGYMGRVVDKAIEDRADELPEIPGCLPLTRGQRRADALGAIAQDSLAGNTATSSGGGPLATVFINAAAASASDGEAGVVVESGPQVGPDTLEMILCSGSVEVTVDAADGRPLAVGPTTKSIPPRLKRWILHRDGGCVADGCTSRYRLEAHHVVPRSAGGGNDPDNLVTLCWFHHHIAIHGYGYRINPRSPRGRVRFLPAPRDPPPGSTRPVESIFRIADRIAVAS